VWPISERAAVAGRAARSAGRGLLLLALALGSLGASAAALAQPQDIRISAPPQRDDIRISALPSPDPAPGDFATIGYRLENTSTDSVELTLTFRTPWGWTPLSGSRSPLVEAGSAVSVPFTFWIPPGACSDSLYKITVDLLGPSGEPLGGLARDIRVSPVHQAGIRAVHPQAVADAGTRVRHLLRLSNLGNTSAAFRLHAESTPEWKTEVVPEEVVLAAGASAEIVAVVSVPSEIPGGTLHLLRVSAEEEPEKTLAGTKRLPARAAAQIRTVVRGVSPPASRYPRLPLEAEVTAESVTPGTLDGELRLVSSGAVSAGAHLDLDADLVHGIRGRSGLQTRHARVRLAGERWDLAAGDVTREFPDLAGQTLSGRGIAVQAENDTWRLRLLGGRDPAVSRAGAWGLGAERALAKRLRLGGDFLLRKEEAGTLGLRTTRLGCVSATADPSKPLRLRLETAWSRTTDSHGAEDGAAAQLFADRLGPRLQVRTRAYLGTSGFTGRTGDRSGVSTYALFAPRTSLRLWANLEGVRGREWENVGSPLETAARIRTGVRWSRAAWPVLELTAGGSSERTGADTLRSLERRDASLAATRSVGSFIGSAACRAGRAFNPLTSRSGDIGGIDLSLGGRIGGLHAMLQWNRDWDRLPDFGAPSRITSSACDLSWGTRSGLLLGGLRLSKRWNETGAEEVGATRDIRVLPSLEVRFLRRLRLRGEATFFGTERRPRPEQWRAQVEYSANDLLPVVWNPVRGGLLGVVFIDANQDGEADPGEERVANVVLMIEGRHEISDERGAFECSALGRGFYWLDLDRGSLPPGLAPRVALPMEVRVEAGRNTPVRIPLSRNGEVTGRIYHERDGDGLLSEGEEGISEIGMVLLGPSGKVAECLTDSTGRYRFGEVPPGRYRLRIAEGWLPPEWVTPGDLEAVVVPGGKVELAPLGAAPKRKPVRITYSKERVSQRP
jgi:hypothetical protein